MAGDQAASRRAQPPLTASPDAAQIRPFERKPAWNSAATWKNTPRIRRRASSKTRPGGVLGMAGAGAGVGVVVGARPLLPGVREIPCEILGADGIAHLVAFISYPTGGSRYRIGVGAQNIPYAQRVRRFELGRCAFRSVGECALPANKLELLGVIRSPGPLRGRADCGRLAIGRVDPAAAPRTSAFQAAARGIREPALIKRPVHHPQ